MAVSKDLSSICKMPRHVVYYSAVALSPCLYDIKLNQCNTTCTMSQDYVSRWRLGGVGGRRNQFLIYITT